MHSLAFMLLKHRLIRIILELGVLGVCRGLILRIEKEKGSAWLPVLHLINELFFILQLN